jgi:hypothetical protein
MPRNASQAVSSALVTSASSTTIIDPAHTREIIARAIAEAPQERGAHGNIPL